MSHPPRMSSVQREMQRALAAIDYSLTNWLWLQRVPCALIQTTVWPGRKPHDWHVLLNITTTN